MTIDAFIFDLDGTLVDSEILWVEAMGTYLNDCDCPCHKDDLLHLVYGRSWVDIYHAITTRFPALASTSSTKMAAGLREHYLRLRDQESGVIIQSSVTLLKTLAKERPVIIVSGSPRADVEEAVLLLGITEEVRFVLGAEDYAQGKPSPSGFLAGASQLGVAPGNCLVFEDSCAGVTAAKAAGMWCVALSRPCSHPQNVSAADWVLPDLSAFSVSTFGRHIQSAKTK